MKPLRHIIK